MASQNRKNQWKRADNYRREQNGFAVDCSRVRNGVVADTHLYGFQTSWDGYWMLCKRIHWSHRYNFLRLKSGIVSNCTIARFNDKTIKARIWKGIVKDFQNSWQRLRWVSKWWWNNTVLGWSLRERIATQSYNSVERRAREGMRRFWWSIGT